MFRFFASLRLHTILLGVLGVMIVLAIITITMVISQRQTDILKSQAIREIALASRLYGDRVAQTVYNSNWATLELFLDKYFESDSHMVYYYVVDATGVIQAASDHSLLGQSRAGMDELVPELKEVIYQTGFSQRTSSQSAWFVVEEAQLSTDHFADQEDRGRKGDHIFDTLREMTYAGSFLGYLRMGFSQRELKAQVAQTRNTLLVLGLVTLLPALFLLLVLVQHSLGPLRQLSAELAKLGKPERQGDFRAQLESLDLGGGTPGSYEVANLREAFAGMKDFILASWDEREAQHQELESLNLLLEESRNTLERRVSERTSELIRANEELTREISERRTAERERTQSEERYRILVEYMLDGVFLMKNGYLVFANQALANMMGSTVKDLLGLPIEDVVAPEHVAMVRDNYADRMKNLPAPNRYEFDLLRRDKKGRVTVLISAGLVKDSDGVPMSLGTLKDITHIKQAEQEKVRLEDELRQGHKMQAVGTLAGGVAHDFNNILQAISGYIQLMLRSKSNRPQDLEYLGEMDLAVQRATRLVERLLTFSRRVKSAKQPVELNREVRRSCDLLNTTLPKMISIQTSLQSDLMQIFADPVQLEQIILNLASNARDAMPEGGVLSFSTCNVYLDQAYTEGKVGLEPGDYVRLLVSDNGHGMTPQVQKHIFEPFFTTKELGKGTGLGLSTVYGVVKAHGGYIGCQSEPGKGTSFEVLFPVMAAAGRSAARDSGLMPDPSQGQGETILVVDDEPAILEIAKEMLGEFGYKVLSASSGEEALDKQRAYGKGLDLIILDLSMPGMGGRRAMEELITHDPELKVIISSGYSSAGEAQASLDLGAKAFVRKPYRFADMLAAIRAVLDGKPVADQPWGENTDMDY